MDSLFKDIPRLGVTKTKPKIGEIRVTIDGTRRKVFDGKCWQYLCTGDPTCLIQSKATCRYHRTPTAVPAPAPPPEEPVEKVKMVRRSRPKVGEMQTMPSGNRRLWKGERWHGLCRVENCPVQAREYCKAHLNQRMSLPNTNEAPVSKAGPALRTRSLTLNSASEKPADDTEETEESPVNARSSSLNRNLSPELSTTSHIQPSPIADPLPTVESASPRRRRTRRRQRSHSPIWKDFSLDEKDPPNRRKQARLNLDTQPSDELPLVSSDTVETSLETSLITERKTSEKRKATGDINNEEHIVPKRKLYGRRRRRKRSNKSLTLSLEPTSSNTSISDLPAKDKSMDESALSDSDVSLRLKPNRLHTNFQSIEIPIQAASPFSFDSSTSAILEQFGTIIKKEAIIEDESLICVPPASSNPVESPCETLQDFLRVEEIKNKEFKLDCQRISYRLAKIQDCIGSISSITT